MALVPSRQFYPTTTAFLDSFHHSSICKLHVSRGLQFVRYGSSCNPFKKHKIIASYDSNYANSNSNPRKRSKLWSRSSKNEVGFSGDTPISQSKLSASGGWLEKWDDTLKQNWPKPPQTVLTYRNSENVEDSDNEYGYASDNGGVNSGSGTTMERIVEKMKKFGYVDDVKEKKEGESREIEKGSIEDIFYVEEGMLPNALGGFSTESPLGVEDVFRGSDGKVRFPWEKPSPEDEERRNSVRLKSKTFVAELTLPESELRRLRNLAFRTKKKTKIGGAGVSQDMVALIKDKWKSAEVLNLKIEGAGALNMKRMHETLERKTGGLVIWRSGSSVALYRGLGYMDPSDKMKKDSYNKKEKSHKSSSSSGEATIVVSSELEQSDILEVPESDSLTTVEGRESTESETNFNYEAEVDKLLEGLGPRYTEWPGGDPLPVDADLLPGVVQGYQPPFRILPYGVKSVLVGREATALRRLARFLPPHFALGRSRQHQGLAAAIIKLWEKSSVAKVALKRGVQLTTSERMAEDIKKLTGGVLLSRNKDFLVFYRGKDFLSPDVAEALLEKERLAKSLQDEEEQARLKASSLIKHSAEIKDQSGSAGTLGETLDADARWGIKLDDSYEEKVLREAEVLRHSYVVRKLDRKLRFAHWKLMKAEKALSKVELSLNPADCRADPESITDEERFMFRKLGLRMKAFLLLGRRGVFDGTVENMHLHWKYRELVKIIVNEKSFEKVKSIALSLESESGGVLVSVDKVSKGYAIVVFRGKDYKRPPLLRPKNLLTKRKALARSIELQRREALLNHISTLQRRVDTLRSEIEHISSVKGQGNEELYDRLDAAYSSEDEDNEDQGEEMYLETYDSENEVDDESNIPIQSNNSTDSHELEKEFPYDFYDEGSETNSSGHQLAVSGASRISQSERDI